MRNLECCIDRLLENGTVGNLIVKAGRGDRVFCDIKKSVDRQDLTDKTLFDMASVTKLMVTTPLALMALDKGVLRLEDSASRFFPTEKPITVRHLLTHTMGIGHKNLIADGNTYDNIGEKILEIPEDVEIGTDVRYSCPGFILLGKILEQVYGMRLDDCFAELVAAPLGLTDTSFLPANKDGAVNANLDEGLRGVVNDYNCRFLGGVAGNAGLFSNLADVTKYVRFMLDRGRPLVSEAIFMDAAQNKTAGMREARGLGFLYVDERYRATGGLFDVGAIGHCGHTGQSVFVDFRTGLYAIILSDATVSTVRKYGREKYVEVVDMREALHEAIRADLVEMGEI